MRGVPSRLVPYRLVDHTADLAIEATGTTQEEVLAQAAVGLTEVVTGRPAHRVAPEQEIKFHIDAPDPEAMVVAFLSELLWLLESRDLLWLGGGVTVGPGPDGSVRLTAAGN